MRAGSAIALLLVMSCATPPRATQVDGWDDAIALPPATDLSPDARVLEVALDAREADVEILPGHPTRAYTYGGAIPGPLLRAHVGDRLIVHFTNHLPEPTTVHWHGVRAPNAMDGVPDVTQPAVMPGESFDYVLDLNDAGLFWYHPHADSAAQVGFGMYGALLVEDASEPVLGDEVVLVLSDIDLMPDGTLTPTTVSGDLATLFGREGNHLLVNGRELPTIEVVAGLPLRLRVVNAAKARYFQLAFERQSLTWIGGDGGLFEAPVPVSEPVLAPGQRGDFVMTPSGPNGSAIVVRWEPFDRGFGTSDGRAPIELMRLAIVAQSSLPPPTPVTLHRVITALDPAAPLTTMTMTMTSLGGHAALGFDGLPFDRTLSAHVGDTQVWELRNDTDWAHPFHLHGFFFQVLGESPRRWRDTVSVPARGSLRIATQFSDRPGMWMFHCHILEHAELGMMGMLDLQ